MRVIFEVLILIAASWWLVRHVPRLRRRIDSRLARLRATFGPMSPARCVKLTVRTAAKAATRTHTGAFLPNDVEVGVHPTDFDSWGPLQSEQPADIASAMGELVAESDFLMMFGQPRVTVKPDPMATSHRPRFKMSLRAQEVAKAKARNIDMPSHPTPVHAGASDMLRSAASKLPAAKRTPSVMPTRRDVTSSYGVPTMRMCTVLVYFGGQVATEFKLTEGRHIVGRAAGSDVVAEHPSVSERHAELVITRNEVTIRDLQSTNSTRVRWALAEVPTRLTDDDVVQLSQSVQLRVANTGVSALSAP